MPFPDPFRSNVNIAITNTTNKGIGVREKVETREDYLSGSTQLFDITPPSVSFCFTVFCRFSSIHVPAREGVSQQEDKSQYLSLLRLHYH